MRTFTLWTALIIAALGIVACGGGGYTAPAVAVATATPTAAPTSTAIATAAPTATAAAATTLATATVLGAPGFVEPSGRTTYVLSDDTTTSLACTVASGCTGVWPPIAPPAGVALSAGFTTFARPDDGGFVQLAYMGHPLYLYAGDSAAGQTNGNGLVSFGGTWTVARP